MPHRKRKSLASVALAVLIAAAWLAPHRALGQSTGLFGQQRTLDRGEQDADEIELGDLRGGIEPGEENSGEPENENTRRGTDGQAGQAGQDGQAGQAGQAGQGRQAGQAGQEGQDRRSGRNGSSRVPGTQIISTDRTRRQLRDNETEVSRQSVEEDPFAALGIRIGSFLLFPEISAETVYSDNIFLSSANPEGDWALELTPQLTARSDWNRHSLTGTISGVHSYHDRFKSEDEETFLAGLAGQIDIRRNTNLVMEANYSRSLEDRSSSDFPDNATERALTRNRDASLEGNHTLNRVTFTLRGELSEEDFDDGTLIDGSSINNDDRDFTERRLTGRAGYEFQPGVTAFVEASTNERDFAERFDDAGTLNGSSGHDIQGGLSFHFTGKLTGEVSAGYALQTPDDASLDDVEGLIFNAGLEWLATGLTTVRFDASSTVAETTQVGSAGSIIRAAELSVEHRPRRNIVLGALVGYEKEEFSGGGDEDDEWRFGLTGEYIFTRSVALIVSYEHLNSTSTTPDSDYTVDEVRFGVRVRR